jgi:hypothetical protein
MEPTSRKSRYAVPLSTLVGSVAVPTTEYVEQQPEQAPVDWVPSSGLARDGGHGDCDGD